MKAEYTHITDSEEDQGKQTFSIEGWEGHKCVDTDALLREPMSVGSTYRQSISRRAGI